MPVPTSTPAAALPGGIYVPVVTFFENTPEQELDLATHSKHIEFLANAGVDGVVTMGSTGEAVTLSRDERKKLTQTAVEAFAKVGNPGPIIVGTVGAQSTAQAIQFATDGHSVGGRYALVLPPSYYPGHMSEDAIQTFYEDVADASPIPILVYSYPGVCSGINMSTDLIGRIARHPNVAGVKHTDHDIGKVARLASLKHTFGSNFTVLGGATDYLLGALAVGGEGAITGMANACPRACLKAYELVKAGKQSEALKLGGLIARAEWSLGKGGLLGTKYSATKFTGLPDSAALGRKPLPVISDATKAHVEAEVGPLAEVERALASEGFVGSILRV